MLRVRLLYLLLLVQNVSELHQTHFNLKKLGVCDVKKNRFQKENFETSW